MGDGPSVILELCEEVFKLAFGYMEGGTDTDPRAKQGQSSGRHLAPIISERSGVRRMVPIIISSASLTVTRPVETMML